MTTLMSQVVTNYNEVVQKTRDPEVDKWPLMGSPGPVLGIVGVYLLFVLKVGPKLMENRPAFQLNKVLIAYNAIQVAFSIWLTSLGLQIDYGRLFTTNGCKLHAAPEEAVQSVLTSAAWWYFFAKIVELLDTVFFVLRKKQNQVSFLHVYHHTITALFSWFYLKFLPGEQGAIIGILNSFVHIIMYTYYLIAALGPEYKKYLWWKKYMTWIQLIQFVLMLSYLLLTLVMDCGMPKALTYFFVTNVVIFLYLFGNFYRKAYAKKQA